MESPLYPIEAKHFSLCFGVSSWDEDDVQIFHFDHTTSYRSQEIVLLAWNMRSVGGPTIADTDKVDVLVCLSLALQEALDAIPDRLVGFWLQHDLVMGAPTADLTDLS